jgi:hypothetical protein
MNQPQHVTLDSPRRFQWAPIADIINTTNPSVENDWVAIPLGSLPGKTPEQKRSAVYNNMARYGLAIRTSIQRASIFVRRGGRKKAGRYSSLMLRAGISHHH